MPSRRFLKVLIMGLPGSGKTTLAADLQRRISIDYKSFWLNADVIRKQFNDWDFSEVGRDRQAKRMKELADLHGKYNDVVICDFVCPLEKTRREFNADYLVYVNTIKESIYADTNKIFECPVKFNFEVKHKNSDHYSRIIGDELVRELRKI